MNLSKAKIAWISSLQIKKFRQKNHKFIVEGDKIVLELLRTPDWEVTSLYALESWLSEHRALLSRPSLEVVAVKAEELKKISLHPTPNQAIAIATPKTFALDKATLQQDISLYLDGIQDPGNLGAILRIADWFGIRHVFLSPGTVDLYNPKVIQASMGAFLRLCVQERTLESLRKEAESLTLLGADLNGCSVFEQQEPIRGVVVVIGNEGNGLSSESRALLDGYITIPAASGSGAESLNAAIATGIVCAVLRNKQVKGA